MKRLISVIFSSMLGVLLCVGLAIVADKLKIVPTFPAFAGEDDFALRFRFFVLVACLGFLLGGAWIGYVSASASRVAVCMWAGVLIGTAISFLVVHLLSPVITDISDRELSNNGVLLFFVCWVLVSMLGAWIAQYALLKSGRASA